MSFLTYIESWFSTINEKIKTFFAGPGGVIVEKALQNLVKIAGAEAASLLVQMAANQTGGKPVLSDIQWSAIANDLKKQAIKQGIVVSETMLDYAISQAAMANAAPGTLPTSGT